MPSVAILRQIAIDLAVPFDKLELWKDIYISPLVIETPARRGWELQVVDDGSDYTSALEGGIRREQFNVTIGIIRAFAIDYDDGNYTRFLKDEARGIHVLKETVITTLEGSFLNDGTNDLLTRPLRVISENKVRKGESQGCLIKEVIFLGGLNAER